MSTIFVAYGGGDHRNTVLAFAVEQAAASGYELLVYHVHESTTESVDTVRKEIERVVQRTDPHVVYEIEIDTRDDVSDRTNVSRQKRLTDAIVAGAETYEYVVMGDIDRGSIKELTHASMTQAVLETHEVPVLLVPV
ncbi:MAG: universal stress protein [Halobacteriales archaeon]|nr:universal stress protein [Halobacteriales archaeon]